jgi:hypothetical protein
MLCFQQVLPSVHDSHDELTNGVAKGPVAYPFGNVTLPRSVPWVIQDTSVGGL